MKGLFCRLIGLCLLAACSSNVEPGDEPPDRTELCSVPAITDATSQTGDVRNVHDPVLTEQGGTYYLFSTGIGIPIRKSTDLVNWVSAGQVFDALPDWALQRVPGVEFPWAPDISLFNREYRLYYSLSTFGSQNSAIGLATNTTLDVTDPAYRWVDRGKVVESTPNQSDYNAIDPNAVVDESGQPWLVWGSFWGGIRMRRLDPSTGLPSREDETIYALASRPVEKAIEGPFIVRHGGFYYLFVSFDACCQGAQSTYKIMVGRSASITGPYLDRNGTSMMDGGGTLVLSGYGRVVGPGHNAVFIHGGRAYLVHHFYDTASNATPTLQIRSLVWTEDGWPLAGEPYKGSFPDGSGPGSSTIAGTWSYLQDSGPSYQVRFKADGTLERCNGEGTWTLNETYLTLRWHTTAGSLAEMVFVAPDGTWFTGRNDNGKTIRGWKIAGP